MFTALFLFAKQSEEPESKTVMLSPPVEKRAVMSANARRRLINSALSDHPVAQETLKTYDAVMQFTETMVQWLVREGLEIEASLVKTIKPIILNKVRFEEIEDRSRFRRSGRLLIAESCCMREGGVSAEM